MILFHFLWQSNIPLCIYTTLSLSIHLFMDGWFHVLAIGNSAPMNIGVHVSFYFYFFPLFKIFKNFLFLFLLYFTLQYCIGFAIHQHESAMGAFELWCWRRLLRVPRIAREIQPVHPKGAQS